MNNTAHHAVLFALWEMARKDRAATVIRLASATGLDRAVVEGSLAALDRSGLAHADRVRLTMQGLATAMMLGAPASSEKPAKRQQLRAA